LFNLSLAVVIACHQKFEVIENDSFQTYISVSIDVLCSLIMYDGFVESDDNFQY